MSLKTRRIEKLASKKCTCYLILGKQQRNSDHNDNSKRLKEYEYELIIMMCNGVLILRKYALYSV